LYLYAKGAQVDRKAVAQTYELFEEPIGFTAPIKFGNWDSLKKKFCYPWILKCNIPKYLCLDFVRLTNSEI
jgi:hypothetical protein